MMMQRRAKVYNKLALVLLSLVVLELVLIGDQVQPFKGLKKKLFMKKLKAMLPLMALVKPKKKIILVPIPLPMFKNPGGLRQQPGPTSGAMSSAASGTSLVMLGGDPLGGVDPQMMMPMMMQPELLANGSIPTTTSLMLGGPFDGMELVSGAGSGAGSGTGSGAGAQLISKRPVTSLRMTSALIQQHRAQQQQQQQQQQQHLYHQSHHHNNWLDGPQHLESFGETLASSAGDGAHSSLPVATSGAGEHYYASPWAQAKLPSFASPAKLLRAAAGSRLRGPQATPQPAASAPSAQLLPVPVPVPVLVRAQPSSGRLQQQQQQPQVQQPQVQQQQQQQSTPTHYPMVVIRNEWRPMPASAPPAPTTKQQQQHHLELEPDVFEPAGPPVGLLRVYQTPDGRLRMSPPPPAQQQHSSSLPVATDAATSARQQPTADEVQLIGLEPATPTPAANHDEPRPSSRAQQQQQQQQQQHRASATSAHSTKGQSAAQLMQAPPIQQSALQSADYRRRA